jgi:hypothetical protein
MIPHAVVVGVGAFCAPFLQGSPQTRAYDSAFNVCGEGTLDIEYITAMTQVGKKRAQLSMRLCPHVGSQGASTYYWGQGVSSQTEGFGELLVDWVSAVASMSTTPLVHSVSYGTYENSFQQSHMTVYLRGYIRRRCARA